MQEKIKVLTHVAHFETEPRTPLADRLLAIGQGVHRIITAEKPEALYVEIPRVAGNYARHEAAGHAGKHGKFQADMQFTHYATGAIVCAAGTLLPGRVTLVPAMKGKKEQRLETVRFLLQSVGRRAEIRNQDDLDAIALGIGTDWPR